MVEGHTLSINNTWFGKREKCALLSNKVLAMVMIMSLGDVTGWLQKWKCDTFKIIKKNKVNAYEGGNINKLIEREKIEPHLTEEKLHDLDCVR